MFIPGISKRSSSTKTLARRKGGGGGGRGGGGRGGHGKSSGKGGSNTKPRTIKSSSGFNFGGKSKSASAYGSGGGPSSIIPAGMPFAGRLQGGGTRSQIFGTRTYGSGYGSTYTTRGVGGRPFPFFFWPLVWGGSAIILADAYLDAKEEVGAGARSFFDPQQLVIESSMQYGGVNNRTRPGGPLSTAIFQSPSINNTFRLVADNATVVSLISDLSTNCSSKFTTNPAPTLTPLDPNASIPRPEQVVQYYRASSIALTLDQYNNTATYAAEGTPDSPLPSTVDMTLLACLNETVGAAAPLIDGETSLWTPSYLSLCWLVWTLWILLEVY